MENVTGDWDERLLDIDICVAWRGVVTVSERFARKKIKQSHWLPGSKLPYVTSGTLSSPDVVN